MTKLHCVLLSFLFACNMLFIGLATAQEEFAEETLGVPWTGGKGITETVGEIVAREQLDKSRKTFSIRPIKREFELPQKYQNNPNAPAVSQWPAVDKTKNIDQLFQTLSPQTVGVSFLGPQISETPGWVPPDCGADVGPSQILIHANGRIKLFDKSGAVGSLNVSDTTFWQSVRNGAGVSDPHIRYDRISGRWFLVIISIPASGANRILIAVSSSSTITSTASFTFFQFQHDLVGTTPNTDTGGFADYPTLGVDANALYIGANIFNAAGTALIGTTGYVVRKSTLLTGTLTVTAFRQLTNGSTTGPLTPQGVHNDDPSATEGYIIGVDAPTFSTLIIRRITNPGGTPSISANISLTVPTTTYPIRQPVNGSVSHRLDALDDRLFAAQLKKNKLTGVTSLWTAHNIEVNSSGVGVASGGRNGSRWYEIRNLSTTPTLNQSGTLFSSATTNPRGFWIPSVAMSGQGHMALGCSYASVADFAGVAVAGRLSGDALGSTQSPTLAHVSSTAYNAQAVDGQRWGDYSQTVVDPNDDMTMWTFDEHCNATDSWGLRAVQLLAPPPATPSSTSPPTISTGATNVDVVVTGTATSGSGFFDPGAGFANRISASVNGGGVTVNSITFTNPTSITLNITVAGGATTGARTITVTNPDAQAATSASGILTINASGCPTITLSPSTLPGGSLSVAYNQTITASGGTGPYSFSVTTGSLPNGLALSSAGVLSGTPTFAGTFNFTVTATDANTCTGSQAYSITIGGCPTITLAPSTLPAGSIGIAYSQTITASGGTPAYFFAVTTGSLPAGLSLTAGGALSGIPTTNGTSNFTVTATDASNCTGNQAYSLIINGSATSISLTTLGSAYTQNFNTLASTGTSSAVSTGWAFIETGTNANTTYTAGTGSSATGDSYSFGATSNSERAFGGLQSGTLNPTIGANFTNNTGSTIVSLSVAYTGEEWRLGTRNRFDSLRFQLSLDATSLTTGIWTPYGSLDFRTPDTSGTVGARDGNTLHTILNSTISSLSIANGASFWIRWTDVNASGADDGLAVDDFSLTPNGAPTNPTATGSANPSTVPAGNGTLLTVTVTPGTSPTSTGITVNGDLSTVGGSPTQSFFDDGTNGDVTTGDNIFSFQDTVGIATSAGGKSLAISVADAQARTASTTISLTVTAPSCPTITVSPSSLPDDVTGTAYNQTISASGGASPYTFAVTAGALPAGLSLSSVGVLDGTPTTSGTYSFTITATDVNTCTGNRAYSMNIITILNANATLAITGTSYDPTPSPGFVGNYTINTTLTNNGPAISSPIYFQIVQLSKVGSDADPAHADKLKSADNGAGVVGDKQTLAISSLGSGASTPVNFVVGLGTRQNFTFLVDLYAVVSGSAAAPGPPLGGTFNACPSITLSPAILPNGTIGVAYSQTITASGGTAPYTFAVTSGSLPTGCTLASGGGISGTPSATGTYDFTVTATDANGCTGNTSYSVGISCPVITISSPPTSPGDVGVPYSYTFTADGGTPPYSFALISGALPSGLTLALSGDVSGTPTIPGSSSFTIRVTDNNGCTLNHADQILIFCPLIDITPSIIPPDSVGRAYNQTLNGTGGTPPYTFGVTSGSLPGGLSLSSSGVLSGSASSGGNYNFSVTVTDLNGCVGQRPFTLTVVDTPISVMIPVNAKWNIISNPVSVSNDSVYQLFPGAISNAFRFGATGYSPVSRLDNGYGYWLNFGSSHTLKIVGMRRLRDTIDVLEGWNILGSLSQTIPVAGVAGVGTTIQSGFFAYDYGYRIADSIKPGGGYWVKSSSAGQIELASGIVVSKNAPFIPSSTDLFPLNRVVIEDAKGSKQTLFFGQKKEGDSPIDLFALPPPPPAGIFDVRFISQRFVETYPSAGDFLNRYRIAISSAVYPLTVRWDVTQAVGERITLTFLAEGVPVKRFALKRSGAIAVASPSVSVLSLTVQRNEEIPSSFALHQNYPNPFNPATTIRFDLSQDAIVSLSVHNLLGQVVSDILSKEAMTAGEQEIELDANALPSGVYFYRLVAQSLTRDGGKDNQTFVSTRKMILMK